MSEVPPNTPKRQAIVERLRQRIDCFRKRHDSCQAQLEETQPSRELKQLQESRIYQSKILENKVKMNAKIRPEQISKLTKQEESGPESKTTAAANNTGLQVLYTLYFLTSKLQPNYKQVDFLFTLNLLLKINFLHLYFRTAFIEHRDLFLYFTYLPKYFRPVRNENSQAHRLTAKDKIMMKCQPPSRRNMLVLKTKMMFIVM